MRTLHAKYRRELRRRSRHGAVSKCATMRHDAHVAPLRPHTKLYPAARRKDLGLAVTRAREAVGFAYRPAFADATGVSVRSILKLEQGDPVGPSVYEAAARVLPGWTVDTPRSILECVDTPPLPGSEPENQPVTPRPPPDGEGWTEADHELMEAIRRFAQTRGIERVTEMLVYALRADWERKKAERDQADQSG